jgi:hypothetical protein
MMERIYGVVGMYACRFEILWLCYALLSTRVSAFVTSKLYLRLDGSQPQVNLNDLPYSE